MSLIQFYSSMFAFKQFLVIFSYCYATKKLGRTGCNTSIALCEKEDNQLSKNYFQFFKRLTETFLISVNIYFFFSYSRNYSPSLLVSTYLCLLTIFRMFQPIFNCVIMSSTKTQDINLISHNHLLSKLVSHCRNLCFNFFKYYKYLIAS